MSTKQLPISSLVEDLTLYPRTQVSSVNVSNIVAALEAGHKVPPIVADEESLRVIDGFHRRRAYLKVLGPDAKIPVTLQHFDSETAMFAAAVELNIAHGLPLQEVERRRIVLRLRELGADDDAVAAVLHMPPDRVEKLTVNIATVVEKGGAIHSEALKRPLFHLRGKELTEAQAKAIRSAPGTSYGLLVRQLRQAIRHRLLNEEDGTLIAELTALGGDIAAYVEKVPTA